MTTQEGTAVKEKKETFGLKERNAFQIYLMTKMGVKHGDVESQENWIKNAKKVSDIIDDEKNEEIRSFIANEKYEEASNLVMALLAE